MAEADPVQAWVDDVVKYAPGLHRRLWGAIQDLMPRRLLMPDYPPTSWRFPGFKPMPVIARPSVDYTTAALDSTVVSMSVVTVPAPSTTYGPVDLQAVADRMAHLLDHAILDQVSQCFHIDVRGLALRQGLTAQSLMAVHPRPESTQTLLDRQTLADAGCLARGCDIRSGFSIGLLCHVLEHNGEQWRVEDEVVRRSQHVNGVALIFKRWAAACHAREDRGAE